MASFIARTLGRCSGEQQLQRQIIREIGGDDHCAIGALLPLLQVIFRLRRSSGAILREHRLQAGN